MLVMPHVIYWGITDCILYLILEEGGKKSVFFKPMGLTLHST
ncbi:Uncharacterised protein [Serratia grimesii]|nr:Uncharacterised protein [Serratia grimesii]SMZ56235.1 Uncharacterised protein [Serratia grimesii]